jgi:hypothetical protein
VRRRGPTKQCVWLGTAGYFCGCRRRITDADTDSDRNINSNCNADGNTNSYSDRNRYANTDSHRHCYSDANACREAHSATTASSHAAAKALIPELARRSPPRWTKAGDWWISEN